MSTHPRRIGKYELQERLGYGGMAEVWKALDTHLQRYVAIKLLHADLKEDPHFIVRFEREAQLIASLHHPNIVKIHDFQIDTSEPGGPVAYMVMDYVEGQTLAHYISSTSGRGNIPSPAEITQLFTSIGLAIDYAHQKGMIHRDIKPANILLDGRNTARNPMGEPILTDFGLARLTGTSAASLTATQMGTPLYISPEQVSGYPGNERSDIYALGVILYEMVTGTLPFRGENPTVVMSQHLNVTPTNPSLINPSIPSALAMVIMRCLAKEPDARFPSASSLATAIAEALNMPVPETLSNPSYPVDAEYMPTYITPVRSSIPLGMTPSSPGWPAAQLTPPASPGQTGSQVALSSNGGQRTPTVAPGNSNPGLFSAGHTEPQATSLSSTQPYSMGAPGTATTPAGGNALAPVQPVPVTPRLANEPPSRPPKRSRWLPFVLIALVIIVLGGSLGAYFLYVRANSGGGQVAGGSIVGHAFYVSSGQLGDGAQGIADQLQVDLQNVPAPPAGKSYYLWLLADKDTTSVPDFLVPAPIHPPLLLTNNLPVQKNGTVQYKYPGDAQHNDLLSATSRLLITLQTAGQSPASPSTDTSTWIYYAQLPQAYIPKDASGLHLRGLDHIRHLYYNENHLQVKGLYGGLDIWIFRNTEKIMELSTSARDDFDGTTKNYQLMHNLFIEILDYLDGIPNVHFDIPFNTPVEADNTIAQIGLLQVNQNQNPPGDLDHMLLHINELNRAPDASLQMHTLSQSIVVATTNAKTWLQKVRADAKQLFNMTPAQLTQPSARALLNDMVTQATFAYIGQLNRATNTVNPGVLQAHYDVQKLATFDITKDVPKSL